MCVVSLSITTPLHSDFLVNSALASRECVTRETKQPNGQTKSTEHTSYLQNMYPYQYIVLLVPSTTVLLHVCPQIEPAITCNTLQEYCFLQTTGTV